MLQVTVTVGGCVYGEYYTILSCNTMSCINLQFCTNIFIYLNGGYVTYAE